MGAVYGLYPYTPDMVPYSPDNLTEYLESELRKLSVPLRILSETWEPPVVVGLSRIGGPFTVEALPAWTTLLGYELFGGSLYTQFFAISADPVTGIISFGGAADAEVTINVSTFFQMFRDVGTFNQELLLRLTDGTNTWAMGAAFITSNQQTILAPGSQIVITVPANTDLWMEASMQNSAHSFEPIEGTFEVATITSRYLFNPGG
jgi:hypothetical protein